jgi:outer membrane protein assembly factor BamB
VKQVKILFLIVFSLLGLVLASCVPGGTQPAQGWSGITLNDGILYTGSMDGKIMAVNPSARSQNLSFPADGEWEYPITAPSGGGFSCSQTSASVAIYGTPAVDGDLVFIGTYAGKVSKVYVLNTSTRSQESSTSLQKRNGEWYYPDPETDEEIEGVVGSPVVSDDAIYVTSSNGKVYCVDKHFGDKKWESDVLAKKLWSTPYIGGDNVYISTFDGHLYALSAEDGSITWSFATESKIGFVSSPAVYEGTIFAGSFDGNLYAVEIGESEPLWKFAGGNCFWAVPVVSNNTVYAACLDGEIYAIDVDNGTELWSFDAGSSIVVSPLLVDDSLVVVSDSGEVYVLKTDAVDDNRVVKKLSIGVSVQAIPCVLDRMVYVRGQDNCLYALDIEQGEVIWKFPLATH